MKKKYLTKTLLILFVLGFPGALSWSQEDEFNMGDQPTVSNPDSSSAPNDDLSLPDDFSPSSQSPSTQSPSNSTADELTLDSTPTQESVQEPTLEESLESSLDAAQPEQQAAPQPQQTPDPTL